MGGTEVKLVESRQAAQTAPTSNNNAPSLPDQGGSYQPVSVLKNTVNIVDSTGIENGFFNSGPFREIITRGIKTIISKPDNRGSITDPRLLANSDEYTINLIEITLPDTDFNTIKERFAKACATNVDVEEGLEELTRRRGYLVEKGAMVSPFGKDLTKIPGGAKPYEDLGAVVLWQNPKILNERTGLDGLNAALNVESLNIPLEAEHIQSGGLTVYGEDGSGRNLKLYILRRMGNLGAGEQSADQPSEEQTTINTNRVQTQPVPEQNTPSAVPQGFDFILNDPKMK